MKDKNHQFIRLAALSYIATFGVHSNAQVLSIVLQPVKIAGNTWAYSSEAVHALGCMRPVNLALGKSFKDEVDLLLERLK